MRQRCEKLGRAGESGVCALVTAEDQAIPKFGGTVKNLFWAASVATLGDLVVIEKNKEISLVQVGVCALHRCVGFWFWFLKKLLYSAFHYYVECNRFYFAMV